MIRSGMQPRISSFEQEKSTDMSGCTGENNSRNGSEIGEMHTPSESTSTTNSLSMDAVQMAILA